MRVFGAIKDVFNYFFIIRKVRKLRKTEEWKNLNLRHDWIYRIYTVVNMRKEDFGENDDMLIVRFTQFAMPIFTYLDENNLSEIVKPTRRRMGKEYAFLLYFSPIFFELDFQYVVSRTFFLIILYSLYKLFMYLDIPSLFKSLF